MPDGYTANYRLILPEFDQRLWHDKIRDNFASIDAILASNFNIPNYLGIWANSTAYAVGDRVADREVGLVFECRVANTSAPTGTFADDRAQRGNLWQSQASATSSAFIAATVTGLGVTPPAFSFTKIAFETVLANVGNGYDVTLSRWTPGRVGLAMISASVTADNMISGARLGVSVVKNGDLTTAGSQLIGDSRATSVPTDDNRIRGAISGLVYIADPADYFEIWAAHSDPTPRNLGRNLSHFHGYFIEPLD